MINTVECVQELEGSTSHMGTYFTSIKEGRLDNSVNLLHDGHFVEFISYVSHLYHSTFTQLSPVGFDL